LLVVALTLPAHIALVRAMQRHEIEREYLALVRGRISGPGRVDAAIGRDPRHRQRMAVVAGGRPAVTHYAIEHPFGHFTLLRVRLETGRTHQIRVHMAHRRHPLVGDPVYSRPQALPRTVPAVLGQALAAFPRQALHARRLAFDHPLTAESLVLQAPVPKDLQTLLDALMRGDPL
jgi:23S rRNA pseudouridine1911/1915/1917 synthase